MQTVYYTTEHFIRHQGNVVDLEAYRRKLTRAGGTLPQGGSAPLTEEPAWAAQPDQTAWLEQDMRLEQSAWEETPEEAPQEKKRWFRRTLSDWLEMTATLTVAAVAITIWLQFVI